MGDEIEIRQALSQLIGLKLGVAHRAADMRVLQFGTIRPAPKSNLPSRKNKPQGSVGDFALHIQCAWRIETDNKIITGCSDLWEPLERHEVLAYDEWDYERDGNLQDQLVEAFMLNCDDLVVEALTIQSHGAFTLHFSCGYKLLVFPWGAMGEDWRLFRPGSDEPHLVVSGGAVERDDP